MVTSVSGCTATRSPKEGAVTQSSTVAPFVVPLAQLLVGSPPTVPGAGTTYGSSPCPNSLFAPECGRAIASASTPTDVPFGNEYLFEFASPADAATALQEQAALEHSSGWLCGLPSQCPVTALNVPSVGVPVVAVSFTLGARGNLSEVNSIATAVKGRYLLSFAWISASTVSAGRVSSPGAVHSYLLAALARLAR